MRKLTDKIFPVYFGIFTFIFYILVYYPSIPSIDFATSLLVFWAALSFSAALCFNRKRDGILFHLYTLVTVILPILLYFLFVILGIDHPMHIAILLITFFGIVLIKIFISNFMEKKEVSDDK
jgi:hypothetical protein